MAWRIGESVVRGEIDNRLQGIIQGKLYVEGIREPVTLELEGDCDPDIAGRRLTFQSLVQRRPVSNADGFAARQCGTAGTMTANRMVRVPTIPDDEVIRCVQARVAIPTRWSESLHLEWFGPNGRVLIEGSSFSCALTPPTWILSEEGHQWSLRNKEKDMFITWDDEEEEDPSPIDGELAADLLSSRAWSAAGAAFVQPHPTVRRLSEFVLQIISESHARRLFAEDEMVNHALEGMIDATVEAWVRLARAMARAGETAGEPGLRRIVAGLQQARWSLGQAFENAGMAAHLCAAESAWLKMIRREFAAMRNELRNLIHHYQDLRQQSAPIPVQSTADVTEEGGRHE